MLLGQHQDVKKILGYVQDRASNLKFMTIVLKSVVSCEVLGVTKSFQGPCFGYAFFLRAYEYATTKKRMCMGLKYVPIKSA